MEENRCIICGDGIPEGRLICPFCEAKYPPEALAKLVEKLQEYVSLEEAVAAIGAAWNEMLSQYITTFQDCWEQLQGWIYTIKEKIPKTPYFFNKKTLIMDKRPHKQHRIRNNCRKERRMNTTNELKKNPFEIGDTVYILGKYLPDSCAPLLLLECKISHIHHRQFVAHRTDGETGEWKFSKKHFNKCVFTDKDKATEELNRRAEGNE